MANSETASWKLTQVGVVVKDVKKVIVDDIGKEIKRLTDKGCTVLLDIRKSVGSDASEIAPTPMMAIGICGGVSGSHPRPLATG